MNLAPIALFVYNRPEHTKQTIEALQKNILAIESDLFIFSDGAKNSDLQQKVNEVRQYIKTVAKFKSVTIEESPTNMGLAASIIHGVTKILEAHGKIIVLEDDIITSPVFLEYMNKSLDIYLNEDNVWHISGYSPPIEIRTETEKHFFIKPTSCWGWATWANRWRYFIRDTDYFISKFDQQSIREFNLNNSYDYYSHLLLNHQKKIKTWAIFWYATVFFNKGLSLHPIKSYTQNIGHDSSGTHCGSSNEYEVTLEEKMLYTFPTEISENVKIKKSLQKYYKTLKPTMIRRLINKFFKFIKR